MMETPLLSVIIPVYNTAPYLRRCMESIIGQTYENLEIICVDDGSTDGSPDILEEYRRMDSRILIIKKENGGLVSARKEGLKQATGEYATYVDSDDYINEEMYTAYMDLMITHRVDIVTGGKVREYEGNQVLEPEVLPVGKYEYKGKKFFLENLIDQNRFFKYNISAHVCDKVFHIDLLKRFQFRVPDGISIGEDAAVIYPLLFAAQSIYVSGRNDYHYCLRSNSIMGTRYTGKDDSTYLMLDYLKEQLLIPEIESRFIFEQQFLLYRRYILLLRNPEEILRYENGYLYPFGKLEKNDRIVLYGAGKFGVALKRFLEMNGFHVVAWVDQAANQRETITWNEAREMPYDRVIIAALIYETTEDIVQRLKEDYVDPKQILRCCGSL